MLHLYYESFNGDKPVCNGGEPPVVYTESSFRDHLNHNEIEYNYDGENSQAWFVIEPMDLNVFFSHHFDFQEKTWKRIKEGSLKFILWMPHEGTYVFNETFMDPFINYFKANGVKDFSNFYFVYGNIDTENYKPVPFKIFPLVYWDYTYMLVMDMRWSEKEVRDAEEVQWHDNPREKRVLCYNANLKKHRLLLISEILRKKYEDQFYLSALRRSYSQEGVLEDESLDQLMPPKGNLQKLFASGKKDPIQEHYNQFIKNYQPIRLDVDQEGLEGKGTDRQQSRIHYENSYLSLVTESTVEDNCLFLTEKVYKPILNLHPFLLFGNPGLLKELKRQGYETFPELFDESYDEERVLYKRFEKVMKNLDDIMAKPKDQLHDQFIGLKDKLFHNREVLLKINFKNRLESLLKELNGGEL
ncbi:MAG: hypothetical protein HRT44_10385 [Bdellovibrionales bacterium]|nr:hypothetical protein [Bdellovibrionales bacterium]NQZ19647.1 hypothetical protein [Bdellovibrionales bacterium]